MATGFYLLDYNPGTRQYVYPRRGAVLSGTIIVHTAECGRDDIGEDSSAENCARFIATRKDYGSYHRLVDSDSIIKMLPWEYEAWQDSNTNPWAVGISSALRTTDWAVMPADRRDRYYRNLAEAAADFVTYMRTKGITVPLKRITGAQARARVAGFCAHGDSGNNRTDPGKDFNWALFFNYVQQALSGVTPASTSTLANTGTTTPKEEDMAVTDTEVDKIAAAVWDRILLNSQNNGVRAGDMLAYIDKNINEGTLAAEAAHTELRNALVRLSTPTVVVTPEDIAAVADALKGALGAAVVAELVKKLAA